MDLYFSPLACSLATRIALYEAGAEANYLEVDPKTKVVRNDGSLSGYHWGVERKRALLEREVQA